jgi:excisionase family DNA binding protein
VNKGQELPFYVGQGVGSRAWDKHTVSNWEYAAGEQKAFCEHFRTNETKVIIYRDNLTPEGSLLVESVLKNVFQSLDANLTNQAECMKRQERPPLELTGLPTPYLPVLSNTNRPIDFKAVVFAGEPPLVHPHRAVAIKPVVFGGEHFFDLSSRTKTSKSVVLNGDDFPDLSSRTKPFKPVVFGGEFLLTDSSLYQDMQRAITRENEIMITATTPERRFFGIAAAAAYASVSVPTIRRWLAAGLVRGYKVGRLVRIDVNELDSAVRGGTPANEVNDATG